MRATEESSGSILGVKGRPTLSTRLQPGRVLRLARTVAPQLLVAATLFCAIGLGVAFGVAPAEVGRAGLTHIAYVHVPATWVALLLYAAIVTCASVQLLGTSRLASMTLEAIVPTGAMFALLALWTGSMWSKAGHDLWWAWDARRLVDLALLAFAVGCVLMREAVGESRSGDTAIAAFAILGGIVVVILLRSVALVPAAGPGQLKVAALASMTAGFLAYAGAVTLKRLRCVILERHRGSAWVQQWSDR